MGKVRRESGGMWGCKVGDLDGKKVEEGIRGKRKGANWLVC